MFHACDPRLLLRTTTLLVWAALAFSAVAWGSRWSNGLGADALSSVTAPTVSAPDGRAAARSLGAQAPAAVVAPALASRLQLLGVMTGGPDQGVALIAIDGKPPQRYRVGAPVTEGLLLQSVHARNVILAASLDGTSALTLDLPRKK